MNGYTIQPDKFLSSFCLSSLPCADCVSLKGWDLLCHKPKRNVISHFAYSEASYPALSPSGESAYDYVISI